jgi:hypothetical protein
MNQEFLLYGLTVCFAIASWFIKDHVAKVADVKADLAKLRESLPQNYVHKDDFRADIQRVFDLLEKINDKLDMKADK